MIAQIGADDCVVFTTLLQKIGCLVPKLTKICSFQRRLVVKGSSFPDLFIGEPALIFSYRYVNLIWARLSKQK